MLSTSSQFDNAANSITTEVDCRVKIEREFNAIADLITVTAADEPFDEKFHKNNVVGVRNPRFNGIAYGPWSEFFTSDDPLHGFRLISEDEFDEDRDKLYYIPVKKDVDLLANVEVDYSQNYKMNAIEVRYENTKTSSTFYNNTIKIYATPNGGGESLLYTGTTNNNGVTRIYWDGTVWSTSVSGMDAIGTDTQSIRVEFIRVDDYNQPRIMYIGGIHIDDISSDDIESVTVNKTEFEQSPFLPIGEPSGNSCDIVLDNTDSRYRFGPGLDRNYFLNNQKITIEFGVNKKYGGGADEFEYVPAGTFYVDSYGYNESDMSVNISGQDRSKFLQETFCGSYVWIDKSTKYIVKDLLARSGISPKNVVFDFGIENNVDESKTRPFTWSTDEQTVWDFLSALAKSDMGTVFYDEQENLVFTDRLDINNKYDAGVQYALSADTNLEDLTEEFVVGANKIKVNYDVLAANTTEVNPVLVYDANNRASYENGGEIPLNQVLWTPSAEDSYLGSATLASELRPSDTYIFITPDSGIQITREEGEVLIGSEFITYKDRTLLGNGKVRLEIVKRNVRGTVYGGVIPTYEGINSNYGARGFKNIDSSTIGWNLEQEREKTQKGFRMFYETETWRAKSGMIGTEFRSNEVTYTTRKRLYNVRFTFNEVSEKKLSDQIAGLYMSLGPGGYGIAFEVSKPETKISINSQTAKESNVRAYKFGPEFGTIPMPPKRTSGDFDGTVIFDEANENKNGTAIDITVIREKYDDRPDQILWYLNGNLVSTFATRYDKDYLGRLGYNSSQAWIGSRGADRGRFGVFTRGGTDITVDYLYATNNSTVGPDELNQTKGFDKYFDMESGSWQLKRDFTGILEYYIEFGAPVHEVVEYDAVHDVFPNLYARVLNTDEKNVTIFSQTHDPFRSKLLVGNTSRQGVNLNDVVYNPDGSSINHAFIIYGISVVEAETDKITTTDGKSVRRYGPQEIEVENPWLNKKKQAIEIASDIKKFWSEPQEFFTAQIMPNPAIQVRDRVSLEYTEKGFELSDVWFINGVSITYDGGFSADLSLRRFRTFPTEDLDYRDDGGIV